MAADSSESNKEHFDADFKENFNQDMLAMLNKGSSNDVRIILSDGEITANKDVLAARCEYFAANLRWKEETKDDSDIIEITDCSKKVMERIIQYLFTGSIKFKDLGILQLLELFNQVRKLLLKSDLLVLIESYMKDMLVSTIRSHSNIKYAEIILALQNADKFALEGVSRDFIFRSVLYSLPLIAKNALGIWIFPTLPFHIITELFSFPLPERIFSNRKNQRILNSAKFKCLLAWKQRNKDNQVFPLGFSLLYFHDKDWPCSGSNYHAQTSKFFCRLPKPIHIWSPRRFPFGHVSGHVATWHVARNVSKWKSPWTPSTYIHQTFARHSKSSMHIHKAECTFNLHSEG